MLDPGETGLDCKNALRSRLVNQIVENHSVCRVVATEGDVCFVVLVDFILFDMAAGRVHKQDPLAIVAEDAIVKNLDLSALTSPNTGLSILSDVVILFNSGVVLLALNGNAIFKILLNPVVPDHGVRSQVVLGQDLNAHVFALPDLIHHDIRVGTYCLNANLALCDLAQLDFGTIPSLNFYARAFYILDGRSEHLRLTIYSLEVDANQRALEYVVILDHHAVVPFRDDMKSSLLEIRKPTVGNLQV